MQFLLLLLPVLVASQGVTDPWTPLDQCLLNYNMTCSSLVYGSLILVDASSYSVGGIMDQQYQFLLNNFIPRYYVQHGQNILSYGDCSSLNQTFLTDHNDACQVTQAKYDYGLEHSGQTALFSSTVQSIYNGYAQLGNTFMFFSATTNLTDVAQTQFPFKNGGQVGVVDWSGHQMWRERKNNGDIGFLMEVYPTSNMDQMSLCLAYFSCSDYTTAQDCANSLYTTTALPTTIGSSTAYPIISSSVPSVINPLADEPQCQCNIGQIWVDVMLAYDSSVNAAANKRDFLEIVSTVKSEMALLPIEMSTASTQYRTSIGSISYGNEAQLVSPLGSQNKDGFENQEIPYTGDPKTNISDALRLAIGQFSTSAHRSNVRPVIVLIANTFTNGEASPLAQATDFKKKGGIIVVYSFDPIVAQQNLNILQQIASPGYFIYNSQDIDDQLPALPKAMCDASCVCPDGYVSPMNDTSRGYPISGCHTASIRKANEVIGQNNCKLQNKGFLSTAKYREKSQYLESLIGQNVKFWIGLTYDKFSDSWFWLDGTTLNTSATAWHPWASGQTASTDACVYEVNMQWTPLSCNPSYSYLCEAQPCSSVLYCDPNN